MDGRISKKEQAIEKKKEIMRKKRHKIRVKKRLVVFVFIVLCTAVIVTVLKAPFFNIASIECTGQEKLSSEYILSVAKVKTGGNIFSVNVEAAKRSVAAIPAVAEANVQRIFPDKIRITVKECTEAAFVKSGGNLFVIDPKGKIIRAVPDDEAGRPEISEILGIAPISEKPGEIISDEKDIVAQQAYECIGLLNELGMLGKVKVIDLRNLSDFRIGYDNRLEIYLGGCENMDYKLKFIRKVIEENISEFEKAKLDYRGDKLYVGALDEEIPVDGENEPAEEAVEGQTELPDGQTAEAVEGQNEPSDGEVAETGEGTETENSGDGQTAEPSNGTVTEGQAAE